MFSFIKNELIEVIEWKEESNDIVLWKFPNEKSNIKYGAQLTVRESQSALFLNEGQIADLYLPGRHTLVTENMPILTTLKSWKHGFESPFKVDVYFVSTRQFSNLKWGTPNPIYLPDPETGKRIQVRAFGVYFIRVKDPKMFFREYAGTKSIVTASELEDILRGFIAPKFAEAAAKSGVSAFDIAIKFTEIGDAIRPLLQADLEPLGLELTKFQITSASLPEDMQQHYNEMVKLEMTSDNAVSKLERLKRANAMEKSAETGNFENWQAQQMGLQGMQQQQMMQQMMMQQMMQNMQNPQNQMMNPMMNPMMQQGFPPQQQGFQQQPPQQPQTPPAAPKMTQQELLEAMETLKKLKDMGMMSDAEFEAKRADLLSRV